MVLVGVLVFSLLLSPTRSVQAAPEEIVIFDLILSEYIEGSGDDKAIEIFNSSPFAVDLSEYSLQISFDGGSSTRELALQGQLAHGSTFVIVNNHASTTLKDIADMVWGQLNFDGNDAVLLKHNGSVIDSIGQLGHNPGTAWSNNGVSTLNSTLRKNALFCFVGDDNPNDPFSPSLIWSSAGVDNFSDLGTYSCWLSAAPVPDDQNVELFEGQSIDITLSGTWVTDDDTYQITVDPLMGTLSGTVPNLVYSPDLNEFGSDQFEFVIIDGETGESSDPATVSINILAVDDQPIADAQTVQVNEDGSTAVTLTGSDVETANNALIFNIIDGPAHGSLTGTEPNLTYTPDADYFGPDSFTFTVNDGSLTSEPATVTIDILSVNDVPEAFAQSVTVDEDGTVDIVLTGDDLETETPALIFEIDTQPLNGNLVLSGNTATYEPAEDYNGSDSFTFTVNDGEDSSSPALVTITVNPVNDQPIADSASVAVDEDDTVEITLTGSDVDTASESLIFAVVDGPIRGVLTGTAPNLAYVPDENYFGPDSFTFTVNDGINTSTPAAVSITVNAVNDNPVAVSDSGSDYAVTADQILIINAPGVLANDSDVDGDELDAVLVDNVSHGILTLNSDGSFTYDPNDDYVGIDTFTYKATDGDLESEVVTVTIIVAAVPVTGEDFTIYLPILLR
jgi:hypothetical protein